MYNLTGMQINIYKVQNFCREYDLKCVIRTITLANVITKFLMLKSVIERNRFQLKINLLPFSLFPIIQGQKFDWCRLVQSLVMNRRKEIGMSVQNNVGRIENLMGSRRSTYNLKGNK